MNSFDAWWAGLPVAQQAASGRRYGTVIRLARTAAGLTLTEAGRRVGYSASALSRIDRGLTALTDITVIRRLAEAFDIPPAVFGLTDTPGDERPGPAPRPAMVPESPATRAGEDPVRRRELLGGLAALSVGR